MRVQLFVCAIDLPQATDTFASVNFAGGDDIGKTEVVSDTVNPNWEKGFVIDSDEGTDVNISVIYVGDESEVGVATFDIEAIMAEKSKVMGKAMDNGGKIFAYATEYEINGNLKFQICGKDLKNTEGFLGLSRDKSDPFYEVQGISGETIFKSEVVKNNLDPIWPEVEIEINALCDGDLDSPIKFSILDQDSNGDTDPMGDFEVSVNGLISSTASGDVVNLSKYGRHIGSILVLGAELVGYENPRKQAMEVMEATANVVLAKADAEAKSQVAATAVEEAEEAKATTEENEQEVNVLAEELTEAEATASAAEEAAKEAAEAAADQTVEGILTFQFSGKHLINTEGIFRKPDPFFVIQKANESDGEIDWSTVYISTVVKDSLSPSWPESDVEISSLCNGDLEETLRVVFYDKESDGKHELMGSFETSINAILTPTDADDAVSIMRGGEETGSIFVSGAKLTDYVDPKLATRKAEEMAEKAEEAKYFVMGKKMTVELESEKAEASRGVANEKAEIANSAVEAAKIAEDTAEQASSVLREIIQ